MNPPEYLDKFSSTLTHVSVIDHGGRTMNLCDGVGRVLDILRRVRADKKKVMLIGNGAEASIASHFALDFWKAGGIRAVTFSSAAQLTALANDYGAEFAFSTPVKIFGDPGDAVFTLSCSGESANVLRAAGVSRVNRYPLVTLTGFEPTNTLRKMGDVNIYVPDDTYGIVESIHALIMHCILDCLPKGDE